MIRFIFVAATVILFLILSIPLMLVEFLIGKKNRHLRDVQSLAVIQCVFRLILRMAGVKITVKGRENVPTDQAVLYVGNHRSYFDILVGYVTVPSLTGFVAKKEMEKIPLLSTWMKYVYCLFLDREDPKQGMKTILQAIDYVKSGISICIFPEGTRNTGEELSLLPFKEGSFKIAEKAGCAIVPISLNNTAQIFEAHLPFVRKTHVVVEYGKPVYPKDLDKETRKHLAPYFEAIIKETIEKNADMV